MHRANPVRSLRSPRAGGGAARTESGGLPLNPGSRGNAENLASRSGDALDAGQNAAGPGSSRYLPRGMPWTERRETRPKWTLATRIVAERRAVQARLAALDRRVRPRRGRRRRQHSSLRDHGGRAGFRVARTALASRSSAVAPQADRSRRSKIREGSYGRCDVCSGSISIARLRALPESVRCVRCANQLSALPSFGVCAPAQGAEHGSEGGVLLEVLSDAASSCQFGDGGPPAFRPSTVGDRGHKVSISRRARSTGSRLWRV